MNRRSPALTDIVVGIAAGLFASFVSKRFQAVWNAAQTAATGEPATGSRGLRERIGMNRRSPALTDIVVGIAAGLFASFVSKRFQAVWNAAQTVATGEPAEGGGAQDDPAPVQAGDRLAELTVGQPVPEPYREPAGDLVHYATGAALGGLYGAAAAMTPAITAGHGIVFGVATTVLMDEALVPALGLSPPPSRTPALKHVYSLATHLVFGLALESARRVLQSKPARAR